MQANGTLPSSSVEGAPVIDGNGQKDSTEPDERLVLLVSWKTLLAVEVRTDVNVEFRSFYSIIRRGFPESNAGSMLFYLPKGALFSEKILIFTSKQLLTAIENSIAASPGVLPTIYWMKDDAPPLISAGSISMKCSVLSKFLEEEGDDVEYQSSAKASKRVCQADSVLDTSSRIGNGIGNTSEKRTGGAAQEMSPSFRRNMSINTNTGSEKQTLGGTSSKMININSSNKNNKSITTSVKNSVKDVDNTKTTTSSKSKIISEDTKCNHVQYFFKVVTSTLRGLLLGRCNDQKITCSMHSEDMAGAQSSNNSPVSRPGGGTGSEHGSFHEKSSERDRPSDRRAAAGSVKEGNSSRSAKAMNRNLQASTTASLDVSKGRTVNTPNEVMMMMTNTTSDSAAAFTGPSCASPVAGNWPVAADKRASIEARLSPGPAPAGVMTSAASGRAIAAAAAGSAGGTDSGVEAAVGVGGGVLCGTLSLDNISRHIASTKTNSAVLSRQISVSCRRVLPCD